MAEVHFFIEVDKLPVWNPDDPGFGQGPERAYGPVAGKESEQYRVTSTFRLREDAMAYAVCRGTVFVQPQWDPKLDTPSKDRVNLVLRPVVAPNNGFTPAHYFIYRGLRRDDFFRPETHPEIDLLPHSDKLSDYMKQVWKDFESNQKAGNTTRTPDPRHTAPRAVSVRRIVRAGRQRQDDADQRRGSDAGVPTRRLAAASGRVGCRSAAVEHRDG